MHNEFKNGQKVMVYGPGENDNKFAAQSPPI